MSQQMAVFDQQSDFYVRGREGEGVKFELVLELEMLF